MTSKIYNFNLPTSNLSHLGQKEKTSSYCQWLVNKIKGIFEKFLAFLRCLFCCKSSDKKESTIDQVKPKSITVQASTTSLKPDLKKKQEADTKVQKKPDQSQTSSIDQTTTTVNASVQGEDFHNESFGNFERIHSDARGLIGEYLEYPDSLNFTKCYPDLSERMYKNLLKEIEMKEVLSTNELFDLFERLKEFCEIFSGPIEINRCYEIVLKHCKNLKEIIIRRPFTEKLLEGICKHLPSSVTALTFECIYLTDSELWIFSKKYPLLHEINLGGCQRITETELSALVENGKQMKRLNLSRCCVTNALLASIATNCNQLEQLSLNGCHLVTDAGLAALATNCKNLQRMDLSQCLITDAGLQVLSANCPKLKEMRLWWSRQVTDAGLRFLAENCKELQNLDLRCCNDITDAGLRVLAENCKHLEELYVGACNRITDAGLRVIAENCKKIRTLDLAQCNLVTDAGLTALSTHCTQLQGLNLSGCFRVSDVGLIPLATNCKQFKCLNLAGCTQMTDAGLGAFATNCKELEILDLTSATNITDRGLKILGENCTHLQRLYLGNNPLITKAGLQALKNQLPALRII